MIGALFRNAVSDAARILRSHRTTTANPFGKTDPSLRGGDIGRFQSRPYFRTTQFLGKAKETRVSPSSLISGFCFSSSSSSSSTASAASLAKSGFIGWYLGMVKSRPVLTKSVTSSLIYIAADLSSQVNFLTFLSFLGFPTCVCVALKHAIAEKMEMVSIFASMILLL